MLETDLEVIRTAIMCHELGWMDPFKHSYLGEISRPGIESSSLVYLVCTFTSYPSLGTSPFIVC